MPRPRHSASDHPSSVQLAAAARALTNDPVATSMSYLFFIRVCLLAMPPDIAGPHPWPDKFVPGDFRDGFDQLPFVYGDALTNQLDGSFLIRFVCKEIPHHSRFSLGIESRDPDVPSCWHRVPNRCTPRAIVTLN